MKYKLSKFNYFFENNNGELILYNSYKGVNSLVKLSGGVKTSFLKYKSGETFYETDEIFDINEFLDKGFFVKASENEDNKINEIFLKKVSNKYLTLVLLPNEKCNFRCKYCYESLNNQEMSENIIEAIINYVKNNIIYYEGLNVSWYGGEPLLSMAHIERLSKEFKKICNIHHKRYFAGITTNGYLLNLETFKKLKNLNVFYYQITLDGDRDNHNVQRPLYNNKGTFDVIINNLKEIHKNIKSSLFKIILRTNCSNVNEKNFVDYLGLIEELLEGDKRFDILLRPVMNWGGEAIKGFKNELLELADFNRFYDKLCNYNIFSFDLYKTYLNPGEAVCYAGLQNQLTITSTGKIFKCTCDINNNQDSQIGMIDDNGDFIIDEGKRIDWITNLNYKNEDCKDCFFAPVCLYDFCPGKRNFKRSQSLTCPFEKYSLKKVLLMFDRMNMIPFLNYKGR